MDVKEKTEVRLVFMGAAGVGKTALIQRFLQDSFEPKHRRTVEELHSKEYEVGGIKVTARPSLARVLFHSFLKAAEPKGTDRSSSPSPGPVHILSAWIECEV